MKIKNYELNAEKTKFSIHKKYFCFLFISLILIHSHSSTKLIKTELKEKTQTKFCNPLCSECSQNDFNFCTVCQTQTVLYKYTCYTKCPEGTYLDETSHCRECDSSCPVCWGPTSSMCGTEHGIRSQVVTLESEIKNFLMTYKFNQNEITQWLNSIKVILNNQSEESLFTDMNFRRLSSQEVYGTVSEVIVDLPLGAFSKLDGVFLPIPSYINENRDFVNSHWVYKKGTWDGSKWVEEFYPRLPSFIREKGETNKIYYENKGFWIWNKQSHWQWKATNIMQEDSINFQDQLALLNSIKIDVIFLLIFC
jgi:hypothetical protein